MEYAIQDLAERDIPWAAHPRFQHLLDTYASETDKTASVWRELRDDQLEFRPHTKSSTVWEVLKHQILSERRFFAEFIGLVEPPAIELLPPWCHTPGVSLRRAFRGPGTAPPGRPCGPGPFGGPAGLTGAAAGSTLA